MNKLKKREPEDPYDCWCMPCIECVYFNEDTHECGHPERLPPEAIERLKLGG